MQNNEEQVIIGCGTLAAVPESATDGKMTVQCGQTKETTALHGKAKRIDRKQKFRLHLYKYMAIIPLALGVC